MNEALCLDIMDQEVLNFISYCKEERITSRYIGSLVADFHRNLLKGGVFLYPRTQKYTNGKLRLLFESNALAFLAEQAGGLAISNDGPILDIQPASIHETAPFYVGTKSIVNKLLELLKK
jgi:fructose-1,6-bisphosphatase I